MAFACGSPSFLIRKMEWILCGNDKLVHCPKNSIMCQTRDYGLRVMYRKNWVAGKLREFNLNEGYVDSKLLDMVVKTEEGNVFYSHSVGIHLRRMLDPTADETDVIKEVTNVLLRQADKAMNVCIVLLKLPKTIVSGRFFNKVANLRNFFDFHSKQFQYRSADVIAVRDVAVERAKVADEVHLLMRECGSAGQSREMTLESLFCVWNNNKDENRVNPLLKSHHDLGQLVKHFPERFYIKDSKVVGLVVPSVRDGTKRFSNSKKNPSSGMVKMLAIKREIQREARILMGQSAAVADGTVDLHQILGTLSDESKQLISCTDELKMFLNLNGDTFRIVNSSTMGFASKVVSASSGKPKNPSGGGVTVPGEGALCVVVGTTVRAYGCDSFLPLKSLWTILTRSTDANIPREFGKVQDLIQFIEQHPERFRMDGFVVGVLLAGADVATASPMALKRCVDEVQPENSVGTRLSDKSISAISQLLMSANHNSQNSALGFFDFKNKKCKENKIYFKLEWVWRKLQAKFNEGRNESLKGFLNALVRHHQDIFVIFKSKKIERTLIHLRTIHRILPSEEWVVEQVRAVLSTRRQLVHDHDALWEAVSPQCRLRFQTKVGVRHFLDYHSKDFN